MATDFYSQLISEASKLVPPTERTVRGFPERIRREAAARLTDLMRAQRPFSFLRLGDMELGLLLAHQKNVPLDWTVLPENKNTSSAVAFAHPGLNPSYIARLRRSYELATFVDFHDRWWINRALNPLLQLRRRPAALRNRSEEDSHIFLDWLKYEFKNYTRNRRCLFAGGEAAILRELWNRTEYRTVASKYVSFDCVAFFEPDAEKINNRIDDIKRCLISRIKEFDIDTLFLSLGGAAKILCAEIAEETGICCFDFGGCMRGLTYSGSDGHSFVRSVHYPFYFRVPFDAFMDAVEAAYPRLHPNQLLVKAQCQVLLELEEHEEGESLPASSKTKKPNPAFISALSSYNRRYKAFFQLNLATRSVSNVC